MFPFSTQGSSKSGGESTDSGSAVNTLSSRAEAQLEPESPISIKPTSDHQAFDQKHLQFQHQQQLEMASDTSRLAGPSESQPAASKPPPEKVLNSQTKTTVLNFLISPLLLLPYPKNSGKGGIFYHYYPCFHLSLSLHKHNCTDPNNSQKIKQKPNSSDF